MLYKSRLFLVWEQWERLRQDPALDVGQVLHSPQCPYAWHVSTQQMFLGHWWALQRVSGSASRTFRAGSHDREYLTKLAHFCTQIEAHKAGNGRQASAPRPPDCPADISCPIPSRLLSPKMARLLCLLRGLSLSTEERLLLAALATSFTPLLLLLMPLLQPCFVVSYFLCLMACCLWCPGDNLALQKDNQKLVFFGEQLNQTTGQVQSLSITRPCPLSRSHWALLVSSRKLLHGHQKVSFAYSGIQSFLGAPRFRRQIPQESGCRMKAKSQPSVKSQIPNFQPHNSRPSPTGYTFPKVAFEWMACHSGSPPTWWMAIQQDFSRGVVLPELVCWESFAFTPRLA